MRNINFGTKLLLILVGTVIVSLGAMIYFITSYSYENADLQAKNYIKATVKSYANEEKAVFDSTIKIVQSMVNRVEIAINTKETLTKAGMVESYKDILKQNDFLFTAWIGFEDDSYIFDRYDGSDKNPYYAPNGTFQPLVTNNKGSLELEALPNFDKNEVYIKYAYDNKRVAISTPYEYEMSSGKKVLMVTISAPIMVNGKIIGVTGVDFTLEAINDRISKIVLFDTGYLSLYETHGVVVSHPRGEAIGKPFSNLTTNPTILGIVEKGIKGEDYDFMTKSLRDGRDSYTYSHPFEFGNTGKYWMLACSVPVDEFMKEANSVRNFSLIFALVVTGLIIAIVMYSMKVLSKNLTAISGGLLGFFAFLNKESDKTTPITLDSKDEFGTMANVINTNIEKTKKLLEQDDILIQDVKRVVEEVKGGSLNSRIEKSTDNTGLEELKNNFNAMLEVTQKNVCSDINKVVAVLESFSKLDFRVKIENDNGKIVNGINELATIINNMLVENKANGLTLEDSSKLLLANVDKLNLSSNEAAASLEETAAALEEITSNIRNNTENIAKMASYSNEIIKASTEGEKLANQTTFAMDEINIKVNLVNEAISVIDNISFQTNILSLNAAVEAATAGEAGKGFAVVAQEVRNLASRSAEAASEIKRIVQEATQKANEGKFIASNMIAGYKSLNESITSTTNLINDVEMSSKEQLNGIEQINDAVNELDRQTQQNAAIASQTNDIALNADEIARLIVEDANKKEFIGKDSVKAKQMQTNVSQKHSYVNIENSKKEKKNIEDISAEKPKPKKLEKISEKVETDEWESF